MAEQATAKLTDDLRDAAEDVVLEHLRDGVDYESVAERDDCADLTDEELGIVHSMASAFLAYFAVEVGCRRRELVPSLLEEARAFIGAPDDAVVVFFSLVHDALGSAE